MRFGTSPKRLHVDRILLLATRFKQFVMLPPSIQRSAWQRLSGIMTSQRRHYRRVEPIPFHVGEQSARAALREKPFWILSLDGGGLRGVFTARILERLHGRFPELLDRVSLVAGTSTGGILALLLAAGYSPADCVRIYEDEGPAVFRKPLIGGLLSYLFKAKYEPIALAQLADRYLGKRTMGDLDKFVLVTAFRVDDKPSQHAVHNQPGDDERRGWRPAVFSNLPFVPGVAIPDSALLCRDAGLRTSAAPTLFPLHQGYADGVLTANNPSLVAVGKVLAHFPKLKRSEMRVLSIGGGW